jgi:WD40 repeat protein
MDHTYLRYECADAFGLTVSSASSRAPQCNSVIRHLPLVEQPSSALSSSSSSPVVVVTTTGSTLTGFNIRTSLPILKIGHRQQLTGGVGTGRSLNSDEVVCLDIQQQQQQDLRAGPVNPQEESINVIKIATGWVDGAVRIFEVYHPKEISNSKSMGVVHSLIEERNIDEDFYQREPLLLNGHTNAPVRTVIFDPYNQSRLASGASDGTIVLWDIIAENGLFRLLGHRGAITATTFIQLENSVETPSSSTLDGLITTSLDGLVKIWDLNAQCCIQTIASHRGEVWSGTCMPLFDGGSKQHDSDAHQLVHHKRWRLITGGNDGKVRVWSVEHTKAEETEIDPSTEIILISSDNTVEDKEESPAATKHTSSNTEVNDDDMVCHFTGSLLPPPNNVATASAEPILCIQYDTLGRFVGVLHTNSKSIDIYLVRSVQQSYNKRHRRLRRRQEKLNKKTSIISDNSNKNGGSSDGKKKRGMLDDPESSDDENDEEEAADSIGRLDVVDNSILQRRDPKLIKASDEFEYISTIHCSHKVRGFTFYYHPQQRKQLQQKHDSKELIRVVCALSTNALETHTVVRQRTE